MKRDIRSGKETPVSELSVPDSNRQAKERSERLRQAARDAGGNVAVARLSGVPLGTLNKYLAGGEMKLAAAVALARACGVSLDWLANGTGSRSGAPREGNPASPPETQAEPIRLFSLVHVDKLAGALEAVTDNFARNGVRPPMHQIVQAALLLYDIMNEPGFDPERAASFAYQDRKDNDRDS